jgi:hypothetical protein
VLQRLRAALVCLSLIATSTALAHDGHVHADEESGAVAATVAASAAAGDTAGRTVIELLSERYEAVVQSHGDHLDIWLDRYDTNEPVTGARVVVTVGESAEVVAEEESPGQYMAPITPLTPGASAALALSIQSAFGDDLLGGTLTDATPPAEPLTSRIVLALEHAVASHAASLPARDTAVLRRLNRTEYRRTLEDLLHLADLHGEILPGALIDFDEQRLDLGFLHCRHAAHCRR